MTPEEYRILFGEDPPAGDPATALAEQDDPVVVDVTGSVPAVELDESVGAPIAELEGASAPARFTLQEPQSKEFVDPRPWWRKKRVQFPVMILAIIILLAIGSDPTP